MTATETWRTDAGHTDDQPDDLVLAVTVVGEAAEVRVADLGGRFDGARGTVGVCVTADVWGLLARLGVEAADGCHRLTVVCDRGRLVVQQHGPPTSGMKPGYTFTSTQAPKTKRDLLGWVSDPDPDGRLRRIVQRWVRLAVRKEGA